MFVERGTVTKNNFAKFVLAKLLTKAIRNVSIQSVVGKGRYVQLKSSKTQRIQTQKYFSVAVSVEAAQANLSMCTIYVTRYASLVRV